MIFIGYMKQLSSVLGTGGFCDSGIFSEYWFQLIHFKILLPMPKPSQQSLRYLINYPSSINHLLPARGRKKLQRALNPIKTGTGLFPLPSFPYSRLFWHYCFRFLFFIFFRFLSPLTSAF